MAGPIGCPIIGNLIQINSRDVSVTGDPAHLMKSHLQAMIYLTYLHLQGTERDTRQSRMTIPEDVQQDLGYVTNDISIVPVQALVDFQAEHEIKLCPKVTQETLDAAKDRFGKMDVAHALHIISKEVAAAIYFSAGRRPAEAHCY